jgi:hypothetical protein
MRIMVAGRIMQIAIRGVKGKIQMCGSPITPKHPGKSIELPGTQGKRRG